MSARTTVVAAFLRLELAEAMRSRWLAATAGIYAILFGGFVWVGLRESSVLGFTGMSRVVLNVTSALVILLPLIALIATTQAIVRSRSNGFFELFLTQPVRRGDWFLALVVSRLVVLVAPLFVFLILSASLGLMLGDVSGWSRASLGAVVVMAALATAFLGMGLFISTLAKTGERAVVRAIVVWLVAAALHDFALIGVLLQWRLPTPLVFALAAVNPVEAGRLGILATVDPELSVFGPVGFWLANSMGPHWTLLFGVVWPLVVGVVFLGLARRHFVRSDLAG